MNIFWGIVLLSGYLQFGWVQETMVIGDQTWQTPDFSTIVDMGINLEFENNFNLEMGMESYQKYTGFDQYSVSSFTPYRMDYKIGAYVNLDGVKVGYKHVCTHVVKTKPNLIQEDFLAGYDTVYLRIDF